MPSGRFTVLAAVISAMVLWVSCTQSSVIYRNDASPSGLSTPTSYPAPDEDIPSEIKAIWETWNILVNEHVDRANLEQSELQKAAIQGMLGLVNDPYTVYLDEASYQLQADAFAGSLEGIGASVAISNQKLVIVAPLPGTPAEKAGILPGDIVLAIDGVSTQGMNLQEAVLRVRGPKGTEVKLLVVHAGSSDPVEMTIVRGVITLRSVYSIVRTDGIGYIALRSFTENTNEMLSEALREMKDQRVGGIILDVRNNPGGLVSATVDVASQFLDEGLVMYEIDGTGNRKDRFALGNPLLPELPLIILVNGLSASGSEVLAGALQDHGRAQLVGTSTFGKGSVNLLRSLPGGSGLYFTLARWYTPNGRLIEGHGLKPDFEVLIGTGEQRDFQLEKATELLLDQIARADS